MGNVHVPPVLTRSKDVRDGSDELVVGQIAAARERAMSQDASGLVAASKREDGSRRVDKENDLWTYMR